MKRDTDNAVINKDNAVKNAKIKILTLELYIPHYTPSLEEYNKLMNQISIKNTHKPSLSRKICFHERSEYSKFLDF